MDNFVITVARGFGSGGKSIASQVAKQLNIPCYENRILEIASQYSGLSEDRFREVDEKLKGSFLLNKLMDIPRSLEPIPKGNFISDEHLYNIQKDIILRLAATESCVIVGKCADFILKDLPNVISIYIEAPRAYCLKRIVERMQVSENEAHKLISKTDKYRAAYYKYYTNGNYWTNPVNYDLTFNSARVGQEKCVQLIIDYLKLKNFI